MLQYFESEEKSNSLNTVVLRPSVFMNRKASVILHCRHRNEPNPKTEQSFLSNFFKLCMLGSLSGKFSADKPTRSQKTGRHVDVHITLASK